MHGEIDLMKVEKDTLWVEKDSFQGKIDLFKREKS